MDLGAQSQSEIKLGLMETRHGATMNSSLPYIDPHLGAKIPGRLSSHVVPTCAPHVPQAWPHSSGPHISHQPAPSKRPALGLLLSLVCRSQVILMPHPKLSLCLEIQAEL